MVEISVIVPIYNVEKYVERCLRSLFTQTKTEGVEFILVNDATPDGSMEVVRRVVAEFPQLDVKIVENEQNKGLMETRFVGVGVATGEYILHIDSDDWVEPTMLEELWAKKCESGADIVVFDGVMEFVDRVTELDHSSVVECGVECARRMLSYRVYPSLWLKLVRRELYAKANIEPIEGLNMGEDLYCSFLLYCECEKVVYLPRKFYHYNRSNDGSITADKSVKTEIDRHRVLESIREFVDRSALDYALFQPSIEGFKIYHKLKFLKGVSFEEMPYCNSVFPEANELILRHPRVNLAQKLLVRCAMIGFWWGFKWLRRHYVAEVNNIKMEYYND